jgi:DNA-binding FadR family transcriptional regulator
MAKKIERLTYGEFAQVDARLHDLISAASGNPLLRESQARLHSHLHLFRLRFDAGVQHDALGEHEQLLAAIGRRDARAAGREMRDHLKASRSRLRLAFDEFPARQRLTRD